MSWSRVFDKRESYRIGSPFEGQWHIEYKIEPLNKKACKQIENHIYKPIDVGDTLHIQLPKRK